MMPIATRCPHAKVKLKVCASVFPFRVFVCWPTKDHLHWNREEVAA